MNFKLALFFMALVGLTIATIQFTQPTNGTVWVAGQSAVIQWSGSSLTSKSMTINLLHGNPNALVLLGSIVKTPENAGSVSLQVPNTLPQDSQYVLSAESQYSNAFTIQNDNVPAGSPFPTNLTLLVNNAGGSSGGDGLHVKEGAVMAGIAAMMAVLQAI